MKLYREESGEGHPLLLLTGLGYAIWSGSGSSRTGHGGSAASRSRTGARGARRSRPALLDRGDGRRCRRSARGPPRPPRRLPMGGYLAQTVALRHPQLVERLVLICTGTGGSGLRSAPRGDRRRLASERRPDAPGVRPRDDAALLPARLDGRAPGRVRAPARRPARAPDSGGVLARAVRRVQRVAPRDDAGGGDRGPDPRRPRRRRPDRPVRERRRAGRRIPGARFEPFPGSGHLLFLESPERLNPLVAEFLA